jgi:cytoskeletal protein CcmA (bactofilin family)
VFLLYLSITSLMMVHLRWSAQAENREIAMLAARSAVNTAIGNIRADLNFKDDILIQWDKEFGDGEAFLTFDPSAGAPWSTNNSQGDTTIEGWDGPEQLSASQVYPRTAKLVAVGECRGSRYVAECMLSFPQFPYALASTGQVLADGELEVLAVDKLSDANDGVTPSEKRAGHIVSNFDGAEAIRLNSRAKVSGDVKAAGLISVNGAEVEGEVLPSAGETHIIDMALKRPTSPGSGGPNEPSAGLYIEDYDPERPELMSEGLSITMSPTDAQAEANGLEVSEVRVKVNATGGPLVLNNGVKLSDGLLYVDGDVVIRGGVQGTGAIFATGKITIVGPTSLDSDTAALISGGGVTLDGQGIGRSKFRGLVATLGDFTADNSEITGAYIAAGTDPVTNLGTSKMILEDVKVVQAPDATKMNLDVHRELKEMLNVGFGARNSSGSQIGLKVGDEFYTFTGDPSLSKAQQQAQLQATYHALKASQEQILSGQYPFSGGKVVAVDADGNPVPDSELGLAFRNTTRKARGQWESYSASVKNTTTQVDVIPILDIDLSKFTSGTSRTRILYYIEN